MSPSFGAQLQHAWQTTLCPVATLWLAITQRLRDVCMIALKAQCSPLALLSAVVAVSWGFRQISASPLNQPNRVKQGPSHLTEECFMAFRDRFVCFERFLQIFSGTEKQPKHKVLVGILSRRTSGWTSRPKNFHPIARSAGEFCFLRGHP